MALTNRAAFTGWVQMVKLKGSDLMPIYKLLDSRDDSDDVITQALANKWPADRMKQFLGFDSSSEVPVPVLQAPIEPEFTPVEEAPAPVFRPAPISGKGGNISRSDEVRARRRGGVPAPALQTAPKPSGKGSFLNRFKKNGPKAGKPSGNRSGGGSKKTILIVVAAVVVLALIGFAALKFSGITGGSDYSFMEPDFAAPSVQAPEYQAPVIPGNKSADPSDRWAQFLAINKNESINRGPFLDKPAHLLDIFSHFPTRWFLWIIFLIPIWSLLKADRFAAREKTDVRSARWGVLALFLGVILAGPISALVEYVVNAFGGSIGSATWPFIFAGVAMNLIVQWVASTSGRTDYSAFSIAGLFFSGAVIIWWFTSLPLIILGSIMMAGGILLQHFEMYRTHQGWKAEFTTLIILVVFTAITSLVYYLAGRVPMITPDMPWIVQFGIALLYNSRLFLGAIIGLLVAYSVGDQISTAIMPPAIAEGVALPGGGRVGRRDDLQNEFDVNARFDAMAYAIMILYPLAALVWYVSIYF